MKNVIGTLFSDYLSEQAVASGEEYAATATKAWQKEQELRQRLDKEQTACFEELLELISQIHFLEVKDAFFTACRLGAGASKELLI